MKQIKRIIATSHIDRHGEAFAIEGLKDMVEQINKEYIPLTLEHDPRIPPHGRVVSARLLQLDDGAYAVEAISDVFERDEEIYLSGDQREISLPTYNPGFMQVVYDYSYRDPESQELINDIASSFGSSPQEFAKKAFEPISILTIAGVFVAGAVTVGFFKKIGADAWDTLKAKIKIVFSKEKRNNRDRLLIFDFTLHGYKTPVNAQIILTNPTANDIEAFFEHGLKHLDQELSAKTALPEEIRKMVFRFSDQGLSLSFGVRKDAVPVHPEAVLRSKKNT